MKIIAAALLASVTALSGLQASPAFELDSLKHQKPYVLEIRYGSHDNPHTQPAPREPSAEFLANAAALNLRVASTDAGQVSDGPFTFGFSLVPEQQAKAFAVAFQGDYRQENSGRTFQGGTLIQLDEWVVLAETISTTFTAKGEQRESFAVVMRLRQD